jgi:hypothetical protein
VFPRLGVARDETKKSWAVPCDEHGNPSLGRREEHGFGGPVVAAFQGDRLATEERSDDLQILLEAADTVVSWESECLVLRVVPTSAQAEDEAAAADLVSGHGHLREQSGRAVGGA